jgi:hypothetical protein
MLKYLKYWHIQNRTKHKEGLVTLTLHFHTCKGLLPLDWSFIIGVLNWNKPSQTLRRAQLLVEKWAPPYNTYDWTHSSLFIMPKLDNLHSCYVSIIHDFCMAFGCVLFVQIKHTWELELAKRKAMDL